jgi:surface polysaccharide O-acyltransferase-like enzyme
MEQTANAHRNPGKIYYINNIKVILTILVVLHHAAITYGAPGSWYYSQKTQHVAELFPLTIFVATNQAFFMGFFFFLSGLFVRSSYERKGGPRFVLDRLKRLGIPLVFYSIVLSPVLNYIAEHYGRDEHESFLSYMSGYHHWIDFGVLWFAAALLIFNLVYVLAARFTKSLWKKPRSFPDNKTLLLWALGLGVFSFLVRLVFPEGWRLEPFGFQLGDFPQYILLFIAGLVASKNHWLDQTTLSQGKTMARGARLLVLVGFSVILIAALVLKIPGENFSGGFHIMSAVYSLWSMVTGVVIITAFLCIGKVKLNGHSPLLTQLSQDSFGVYIFHPLFLISLSVAIRFWNIDPGIKLLLVGPLAVLTSFLFVSLIRKIPLVRSII